MPAGGDTRPLPDLREEADRVLDRADQTGVIVRATGGLAVWLRCPSSRRPPLARDYKDLDLVARRGHADAVSGLLGGLGYGADEEFNSLHGHQRLYFWDSANQRRLDVFIERMSMCHELDLTGRVELDQRTLTPADLLLSKLQVVETNERDLKDATALLIDHELAGDGIDPERVAAVLANDWGWWRTATETMTRIEVFAGSLGLNAAGGRVTGLRSLIDTAPKGWRWKARARIGERVRWYELPEEIEG